MWIEQRGFQDRAYHRNPLPLSAWGGHARRLAIRLWEDEPRLEVEPTELVVAAVLSEPAYSSASRWKSKWSRHCPAMRR